MIIQKDYKFYAAHRNEELTDKCRNLHGHRYGIRCFFEVERTGSYSTLFADFDDKIEPHHDGHRFLAPSGWHEYGVGFGADLGVVPEDSPAWWMAEWNVPVTANCIALSGAYPNQPQPVTAWKIELRQDGVWKGHAQGVGGWYNDGRYTWGGRAEKPVPFDAIRVCLFSKDEKTPLKSIHFRGEEAASWIVAWFPPKCG